MSGETSTEIVPVYVWEVPVRITHWLIALSLFVLSATGLYIGRPFMTVPGEAGQWFVMGWMQIIHFYAAIVFTVRCDCARDLDVHRQQVRAMGQVSCCAWSAAEHGMLPTVLFYSFLRDKPAAYVGSQPGGRVRLSARVRSVLPRHWYGAGHVGAERRSRLTSPMVRAVGAALRRTFRSRGGFITW